MTYKYEVRYLVQRLCGGVWEPYDDAPPTAFDTARRREQHLSDRINPNELRVAAVPITLDCVEK